MTNTNLRAFLDRDVQDLVDAVKTSVREHIGKLRARGDQVSGYAILPGSEDQVVNLVANHTCEIDPSDGESCLVDEWPNYEYDEFGSANDLIKLSNSQFDSLCANQDSSDPDAFQNRNAHITKLHEAILTALSELRQEGVLGGEDRFAVIWIPDSTSEIMFRSAKELNHPKVYKSFMSECG